VRVEPAHLRRDEAAEDEQRTGDLDKRDKSHDVVRAVFAGPGTAALLVRVGAGTGAFATDFSRVSLWPAVWLLTTLTSTVVQE